MVEGIPRLTVLNERVAWSVQIRDWELLVRTLTLLEKTEWEEILKPHVEIILANGRAALTDIVEGQWLDRRGDMNILAWKLRRMARGWKHRTRARRQLMDIVTDLRDAWGVR